MQFGEDSEVPLLFEGDFPGALFRLLSSGLFSLAHLFMVQYALLHKWYRTIRLEFEVTVRDR
jgi:hypothetical protein